MVPMRGSPTVKVDSGPQQVRAVTLQSQVRCFTMLLDGYLRITAATLGRTTLRHLHSAIDASASTGPVSREMVPTAAGFTEWQGQSLPALSVGWDWVLTTAGLELIAGSLRSNVMLVDDSGADLGPQANQSLLEAWLQGWDWQGEVLQILYLR